MSMYFTESESRQFSFYRMPKELMSNPYYQEMSTDAKLLYGLMLDRMELSMKNHWVDDNERVYIYFTVEDVLEYMKCANQKAAKLMKELEKYELIERKRQGLGHPTRIYVKTFIRPYDRKPAVCKCENHTSQGVKVTSSEVGKSSANDTEKNDTEKNHTEKNNTYSIESDSIRWGKITYRDEWEQYFRAQIHVNSLLIDYPYEKDTILGILELLVDTCSSNKEWIRIGGEERPAEVIRSRLMKLNMGHIQYVMDCLKENHTDVRDIRQYLLAALYNAPATMESYYRAQVNHYDSL